MQYDQPINVIKIDQSTWERSELFTLFNSFSDPYHGVCLRIDCTETFTYAKDHGLSVFLSLLHRSLVAAQKVDNFCIRVFEDAVWKYETIHGGSAIGRANGTIAFGHYPYHPQIASFVKEASAEVARVKGRTDIDRYPYQDLIRYSVLPWFDFTSISHAHDAARRDSAPKITFGKITQYDGRRTMPVSIHVHHGIIDGSHVAEFVEHFQQALTAPDSEECNPTHPLRV